MPSRTRAGRADADAARVARLWEAIRRTRDELAARAVREERVTTRFDALIRPRERAFTRAVCRLTEQLVDHHELTSLAGDEHALLGLWIDENLQSLATHPFAPRADADALARRWRLHLAAARHPLDETLASLQRRRGYADTAEEDAAWSEADGEEGAPPGERRDEEASGAGGRSEAGATRGGGGRGGADRASEEEASDTIDEDSRRVVSRLFRRLARALHPDLEPDEARRLDKHRLMSECLRARDQGDVDTLLSLHAAYVGPLPDDLAGHDPAVLARLLRRQLDALLARLRRIAPGDALQRMLIERYGADDAPETERRFAAHAAALDAEIARLERLATSLVTADGLREALLVRRELEFDRLAIDELTGAMRHG